MASETKNEISHYKLVKKLCEKLKAQDMRVATALAIIAQHFDIIINDKAYLAIRCTESEETVAIDEESTEKHKRNIKLAKEKTIKMTIYMTNLTVEIIVSQIENRPEDTRIFITRDTIECYARCD